MTLLLIGFKASETLLGIETIFSYRKHRQLIMLQSLWNPFRDWNPYGVIADGYQEPSFKASETLLGIETSYHSTLANVPPASKPLKPF